MIFSKRAASYSKFSFAGSRLPSGIRSMIGKKFNLINHFQYVLLRRGGGGGIVLTGELGGCCNSTKDSKLGKFYKTNLSFHFFLFLMKAIVINYNKSSLLFTVRNTKII